MADELKFPTFDCVISNTVEDYDSEVECFFLNSSRLVAELDEIRRNDKEWDRNYLQIMKYLSTLNGSIVDLKEPPSHEFLIQLSLGEELEDNTLERMLRSKSSLTASLHKASLTAREVMFWYVRNSKSEKFSKAFNPERFQGLPFLRLALTYRSIQVSNR